MSELPIAPVLDEKSEQIKNNADRMLNDPYQNAAFFKHAERQVAPQPAYVEKWDLEEPVEAFNPDKVPQETIVYTQAPEYVAPPLTHEQKTERDLMFYDDKQLVAYALANTRAVVSMRHLI